ncbi:MAG: ABC transporter ATP-binding protein [Deferribacterales bacterium]|nr:ABC transporter ATP-binding protein [Deferribacterales bacterium]
MLEFKNISKQYKIGENTLTVLDNFNETLHQGELIALVGPSGAGKSTLLHIAGGLDAPTEGEVLFNGRNIYSLKESELNKYRGSHVGFVFQSHYLLDDFTAIDNIMLQKFILTGDRKQAEKEAAVLLDSVGLSDRAAHYPFELSGGEQQRIAVARALINSPEMVFADEPTGNLDKANSEAVIDILSSLRDKGVCVVIVTHDETIASRCPKCIRLEKK